MDEKKKVKTAVLEGEITRRSGGKLFSFILAVTGIAFLRAIVQFIATYILGFRRKGRVSAEGYLLKIEIESYMLGRRVRQSQAHVPFRNIIYIQKDDSISLLPVLGAAMGLMAGFAAGFVFLVQWSMTLLGIYIIIGFACILLGIAVDFLFSFIIPRIRGRSSFIFATQKEVYRMRGVPEKQISGFMEKWSNAFVVK